MAVGRWYTSSVVLLAGVFSACSGKLGTPGEPEADAGTRASRPHSSPQDTSSQSPEASGRIGPAGGTVTIKDGIARGATIAIPAGALSTPTTITMRVTSRPTDMPPDTFVAGPVVEFGPSGQTFAKPTTITLPATRPSVGIYTRHKGGPWISIPDAHYDPSRKVMVASLDHFSPAFPFTDLSNPPGSSPPGRLSSGYLLKQDNAGKFACTVTCGVTLVTVATASQDTGNVVITTPGCLSQDTEASHYLVGFGDVCSVQSIVIQPNSQTIDGSPCQGTPTDGNNPIPSLYPVQRILQEIQPLKTDPPSSPYGIVTMILGKHPADIQPVPAAATTIPFELRGYWMEYYRYSDGNTPSIQKKSDWLALVFALGMSQQNNTTEWTTLITAFPTTSPGATLMPEDRGGGLYAAEDTGAVSLMGLLFDTNPRFVAVSHFYPQIDGVITAVKNWNDCY